MSRRRRVIPWLPVIVPRPCMSPAVAPTGADRLTKKVSLSSIVRSPVIETVTFWLVEPGANVNVPDVAV